MRKVERLKREAKDACEWRGHEMYRFERGFVYTNMHYTSCKKCGMDVTVNTNPMPNQISIAGEAVALNCDRGFLSTC